MPRRPKAPEIFGKKESPRELTQEHLRRIFEPMMDLRDRLGEALSPHDQTRKRFIDAVVRVAVAGQAQDGTYTFRVKNVNRHSRDPVKREFVGPTFTEGELLDGPLRWGRLIVNTSGTSLESIELMACQDEIDPYLVSIVPESLSRVALLPDGTLEAYPWQTRETARLLGGHWSHVDAPLTFSWTMDYFERVA